MSIAIIAPAKNAKPWIAALTKLQPNLEVQVWPEIHNPQSVKLALVWQHPKDTLEPLVNCELVVSMGAGVDHLVKDKYLVDSAIVCARLVDIQLAKMMAEYLIALIEAHRHHFFFYQKCQQQQQWQPRETLSKTKFKIGVMGLGQIGEQVALALHTNGYDVIGWRNSNLALTALPKFAIETYYGLDQAEAFFKQSNWLINLLPLTSKTHSILSKRVFQQVPAQSVLVNLGRGDHLNEADLLEALRCGQISQAYLDVYSQEPLPKTHAFWKHQQVIMTPHISSLTQPDSVAPQIIENYQRLASGEQLLNTVCLSKEY
jgi:glyoxylate/hydroxypyruvate reductase